jgi:hypothetical protein
VAFVSRVTGAELTCLKPGFSFSIVVIIDRFAAIIDDWKCFMRPLDE